MCASYKGTSPPVWVLITFTDSIKKRSIKLMRAIGQTHSVQIRYNSASRDRVNRRDVDPCRLWYNAGKLYLIGYCHVRKAVRMFAVERIRSLTISNRPCQVPLGFDLEA